MVAMREVQALQEVLVVAAKALVAMETMLVALELQAKVLLVVMVLVHVQRPQKRAAAGAALVL
jgi:hypothetical protein